MSKSTKRGRPSKFSAEMCKQVVKLCRLGAMDTELADFFEVSVQTINTWKKEHPEFVESIKRGKLKADAEIAHKLFHRAKGYSHPDVHISNYQGQITTTPITKHYAPDTTACIFWLKNRQPELWRDRHEFTGKDGGPIQHADVSDMEVARRVAYQFRQAEKQETHH